MGRLSGIQSFLEGFNGTYGTVRRVMQDKALQDIAKAEQSTVDGYNAADGQQLEAIAAAKDENGNPYYSIGTDAQGRYTVTPNQGGAGFEAGQAVQLPTKERTQFLGQAYDKPLSESEASTARTMASAGVMRRFGDPRGALALEQSARQGQREEQRFALDQRRAEREDRAGAQREADEQQLRAIDSEVANWSSKRLLNPDGSARDATPDDQLAAGQYRVAKLIGAGRLSDANAMAKDNMAMAANKIQLQTAERNEALAQTAAAVSAGDLTKLAPFYERFVPDGARITNIVQDAKTGKVTIERETLDGRALPPKVAKDTNEILAGLKAFQDPMALYNFSQSEFARNLQVKADKRADAQLGLAGAASRRAEEDHAAGLPKRQLESTVATLQLGLANAATPEERAAIQDKLNAVQGGLGFGKDQPAEVKLAQAMLKAGVATDMRSALEMAITKKGKNADEVHQEFVAAGTKNMMKPADAVKQADELMKEMGYSKKGGRWAQQAGAGGSDIASDPRAVAIRDNPSLTVEQKKAELQKLGYR